ncbi:sugar kinase [candidate division WOR-3 bacterium]|nr:sugar kinase [candidate division WOR-3 bacterium]
MNEILAVGSVALDTIENSKGKFKDIPGGSLSYFVSSAALYVKVIPLGIVGDDFPPFSEAWGGGRKIDGSNFSIARGRTFRWWGKYDEDLDFRQTLYTDLGVFENFKPLLTSSAKKAPYVFLGNISPELQLEVISQTNKTSFKALDTMNYWIDGFRDALMEAVSKVDLLIINDQELVHLTGKQSEISALMDLFDIGLKYVVLKRGKHGALVFSKENFKNCGIYEHAQVVDTTGAGDCFAGGLMGYLASTTIRCEIDTPVGWKNMKSSLKRGAAAASFAIEGFGLSSLIKAKKKDIEARTREIKK